MKLGAIGIVSNNIEKSLAFYNQLGLTFKSFSEDHYECQLDNGMRIMIDSLDLMKKINPEYVRPESSHISFCFEQNTPQAVDDLVKKLKDSNYAVSKEPWDAFWGQRYAVVKGPEGTQVDIYSPLP